MTTLGRLAQEKFTDAAVGRLLDALEPWGATLAYNSDEASLIRPKRRGYAVRQAAQVP